MCIYAHTATGTCIFFSPKMSKIYWKKVNIQQIVLRNLDINIQKNGTELYLSLCTKVSCTLMVDLIIFPDGQKFLDEKVGSILTGFTAESWYLFSTS